jgi:hypothetical protein
LKPVLPLFYEPLVPFEVLLLLGPHRQQIFHPVCVVS